MQVYRIAKNKYIRDLTGIGAKTVGGRWNPKGVAVLYTSTNAALSALEVLAHLPAAYFPNDMEIATIELPDELITEIKIEDLPDNWNEIPPPLEVQNFTMSWITDNTHLGLKIPSIIIPKEQNLLINPEHPDFKQVKLIDVAPFSFDTRLLR
ncbi:RES family NAD+ phosphorylase [Aquimarina hainanensis]|uniref:RES family NAD+ phosphorylase n=1 Tax=Aquimarina hainanensis TaxID=1578017 RepID=A0ABW5NF29_9FLAO|nr:RES family NAD+ phosphorylase [Aquimarina sp. TRL1]QKX07369.1 RES family NAD+ phosphorylase [Aquimarina sp. TRL1]